MSYNPPSDFETNIRALAPQVDKIVIVDNQSSSAARQVVEEVASTYKAATIWNDQNVGIAGALNAGVRMALASDVCEWILLLDQDSRVPQTFISTCLDAYGDCSFKDEVALVGANYQLSLRSVPTVSSSDQVHRFRETASLMTSGTMVKATAFLKCGGFDESFFMDYVDHEFCFRARRNNFRIIQVSNAILQHKLGSPTAHRLLGISFVTSNYSPNRRYHNARNRVVLYRRYFSNEATWIVSSCFRWMLETVKMILVEDGRWEKLSSTLRGTWDGFGASKWSEIVSVSITNNSVATPRQME